MSNKQWGHGFHTGREQGRKETTLFFGATLTAITLGVKGYNFVKEKYPAKMSKLNLRKKN